MDNDCEILVRQGSKVSVVVPTEPAGQPPAILLINPKQANNVGSILRACSCYGIRQLWYTGTRVDLGFTKHQRAIKNSSAGKFRLPREERMKGYAECRIHEYDRPFDMFPDVVPIAIEILPGTVPLPQFEHPHNALYVFGPEDGSLNGSVLGRCHQFVSIPSRHCLNLAAAVYTVLYDRQVKCSPGVRLEDMLQEQRGRKELA